MNLVRQVNQYQTLEDVQLGATLPDGGRKRRLAILRDDQRGKIAGRSGQEFKISHFAFYILLLLTAVTPGCGPSNSAAAPSTPTARLEAVWGRPGNADGRLFKPRAITIDPQDHLYLVDMTARIQVFDADGRFLRGWQTPEHQFGRPTGLSIGRDGNVLVADTHYHRVLIYSPQGELLRTQGGTEGHRPGEFELPTHVIQDRQGNYYVAEYGDYDRIQKFSPDWRFLLQWGSHGEAPGQFIRPQKMALDDHDRLWVTDACNHRIQVFSIAGKLLFLWGTQGERPGELYYPYDLALASDGSLYVCEFGNHRVQHFTAEGRSLGCWGTCGHDEGQLYNPWGVVRDRSARLFVLDTYNHRVQRIRW